MNKTLRRIISKNLDLTSRDDLVDALNVKITDSTFREALLDGFEAIDKALTDFDRVLDMRDRSLSVSSREMVTLNQEISEQSKKQQDILGQMQATLRILQEGQSGDAAMEERDLKKLVDTVEQLVKSQLNSSRDLQLLFDQGLAISQTMTFKDLETQVRASISKIAREELKARIFFAGHLFGLSDKLQFYTCDVDNQPDDLFDLHGRDRAKNFQYLNINSPKENTVLAIIRIEFSSEEQGSALINRIKLLLPNIAATLENIRLMHEEKRKQRLEAELQTARFVQQALLPVANPRVADGSLEISGYYQNASECGGDWWTYFRLNDGRHIVLLGDVTGHGTGSAIVCAVVKGYCDSLVDRKGLTLTDLLSELNRVVFGISRTAGRAMTMVAVALDPTKDEMTYANAGHPQPILVKPLTAGSTGRDTGFLVNSGNVLGVSEDVTFVEKKMRFAPGEQLVLYSDGLTERLSRQKDMYGESRLCRVLMKAKAHYGAAELNKEIIRDLQDFAMGHDPIDDITSVVIKNVSDEQSIKSISFKSSTAP